MIVLRSAVFLIATLASSHVLAAQTFSREMALRQLGWQVPSSPAPHIWVSFLGNDDLVISTVNEIDSPAYAWRQHRSFVPPKLFVHVLHVTNSSIQETARVTLDAGSSQDRAVSVGASYIVVNSLDGVHLFNSILQPLAARPIAEVCGTPQLNPGDKIESAYVSASDRNVATITYSYIQAVESTSQPSTGVVRVSCWFTVPQLTPLAVNKRSRIGMWDTASGSRFLTSIPGFTRSIDPSGDSTFLMPTQCGRNSYLLDTRLPVLLQFDGSIAINCQDRKLLILSGTKVSEYWLDRRMKDFTIEASAREAPVLAAIQAHTSQTSDKFATTFHASIFNYRTGARWYSSWSSVQSGAAVFFDQSKPALSADGGKLALTVGDKLVVFQRDAGAPAKSPASSKSE